MAFFGRGKGPGLFCETLFVDEGPSCVLKVTIYTTWQVGCCHLASNVKPQLGGATHLATQGFFGRLAFSNTTRVTAKARGSSFALAQTLYRVADTEQKQQQPGLGGRDWQIFSALVYIVQALLVV
jgi:hypothetical protein